MLIEIVGRMEIFLNFGMFSWDQKSSCGWKRVCMKSQQRNDFYLKSYIFKKSRSNFQLIVAKNLIILRSDKILKYTLLCSSETVDICSNFSDFAEVFK